ncbi:MAG: hypothetical protein IH989_02100 [Planctomycetes bacterium]|nr:hypothetical protein [Planctomycetota bacterium]
MRRAFRSFIGCAVMLLAVSAVAGEQDPTSMQGGIQPMCAVGHWDDYSGLYSDVWGDGNYAYLPNWGADGNEGRVHIIDISDPANPTLASTFFIPPPNENASPQDVKVANGLLFIALESDANDGVAIVDVRDPTNPLMLATVRIPGNETVHNVFYDNGYLYTPEGTTIFITDLTSFDPDNPPASPITTPKWTLTNVGTSNVHDITVKNGRLYAAGWDSGLWIYDVSNVATTFPTLVGTVGGNNTHSMWPTDDGQFVVTGEERGGGGIHVYRITDVGGSLTLTLTDSLALPNTFSVHNQMFVGNRLYNSWYAQGMQVFDIDPITGLLQLVGSFDTSSTGTGNWGVYPLLGSDRILLSDTEEGLFVVTETCVCEPSLAPVAEMIGTDVSTKNRMLSFTAGEPGRLQAIRVTFMDLPAPYDLWNGQSLWVTAPTLVSERGASVAPFPGFPNFNASRLQCGEPVFQEWDQFPTVHVFHEGIVPGGSYRVQVIGATCPDLLAEGSYSPPLELTAARWGDTVRDLSATPPAPPEGSVNIDDALGILARFSGVAGAIIKARADLEPRCPDLLINVSDVLASLAGFVGLPYPFEPTAPGACDSTCSNPLP